MYMWVEAELEKELDVEDVHLFQTQMKISYGEYPQLQVFISFPTSLKFPEQGKNNKNCS